MYEWQQKIQQMIDEIDNCIRLHDNEALTLRRLSEGLGYSEYFLTRKFQEITGMQFRDYLRQRDRKNTSELQSQSGISV